MLILSEFRHFIVIMIIWIMLDSDSSSNLSAMEHKLSLHSKRRHGVIFFFFCGDNENSCWNQITVKPVCSDHLSHKVYYLWFIQ